MLKRFHSCTFRVTSKGNCVLLCTLALVSVILTTSGCATWGTKTHSESKAYALYLLIGQSNMAGRGEIGQIDTMPHPRVFSLNPDYRFIPAREPLHFDKANRGTGPGLAFGKAMAQKYPGTLIGLIPAAVGGTKIAYWHPDHERALYERALTMAKAAMKFGTLKGIVWQQGESDSNQKDAPLYKTRLIELIRSLRKDLGNPELPVVLGGLGNFLKSDNYKVVNKALREVAQELPCVEFSEASKAGHIGDRLHFNATAQHENGKNMANAMVRAGQNEK